jgi:hypothetical protein
MKTSVETIHIFKEASEAQLEVRHARIAHA